MIVQSVWHGPRLNAGPNSTWRTTGRQSSLPTLQRMWFLNTSYHVFNTRNTLYTERSNMSRNAGKRRSAPVLFKSVTSFTNTLFVRSSPRVMGPRLLSVRIFWPGSTQDVSEESGLSWCSGSQNGRCLSERKLSLSIPLISQPMEVGLCWVM